eukprot:5892461-Lingulodinium_polyedra.AAC.1
MRPPTEQAQLAQRAAQGWRATPMAARGTGRAGSAPRGTTPRVARWPPAPSPARPRPGWNPLAPSRWSPGCAALR